jgi:antirestriction protein ArdC
LEFDRLVLAEDEGYAMEELVAELGSAFVSADLDLTPEVREDHASYIASWLKVPSSDKRAIFTAASHAQRAADFLHGLQDNSAHRGKPKPHSRAGGGAGGKPLHTPAFTLRQKCYFAGAKRVL